MPVLLKNNAFSTLTTAISASDTGIVVASGAQFPALAAGQYFYATLVSPAGTTEIVKVTARVSNSMTVVRAQDGSTAASFQVGTLVEMRVNAATVNDLVDEHDQAAEISIADAGGYYTGTNVEGALVEVAQKTLTFVSLATLLLDTTLTYSNAPAGTVIRTRSEGFAYTVAASGAADHHIITAGGVKLYVSGLVVDVRAFGAKGDGITDDAPAINKAIQSTAKKIVIPSGTYLIGTSAPNFLLFNSAASGKVFEGAGGVLKLAASTPVLSSKAALQVEDCTDLIVRGVRFDGNAANNTGNTLSSTGLVGFLSTLRSRRIIVTENIVENSNNNGVYFNEGSRECVCSNNVFRNCFGTEMRVGLPNGPILAEGVFVGNTVVLDIDVHPGVPKQDGMLAVRWGGDAVFIGNKIVIASNVVDRPASLIWIAQCRRVIISDNEVVTEAGGSYAIQGNITADAQEIIVRGNNFKAGQGILFTDGGGAARAVGTIIIEGNYIKALGQDGVLVRPTIGLAVEECVIANNVIEYQNGYAIECSVGKSVISGNRIKRNGGSHCIFLRGDSNVVDGNVIDVGGATIRGIEIYATDSVVSGNRVYNYTGTPIREQSTANWNLIHGNHTKGGTITVIGANTVLADNI